MQITEKNGRKQIWLQTEKELRAYVHPLRPVSYTHLTLPTN